MTPAAASTSVHDRSPSTPRHRRVGDAGVARHCRVDDMQAARRDRFGGTIGANRRAMARRRCELRGVTLMARLVCLKAHTDRSQRRAESCQPVATRVPTAIKQGPPSHAVGALRTSVRFAGRIASPLQGGGKNPAAYRTGEIGRISGLHPHHIDPSDEGVDGQVRPLRRVSQRIPENGLQTDRGLVPGDRHAPFDRRGKGRPHRPIRAFDRVALVHQYMCCPPLSDKVVPVTKPASSLHRKATPRAISLAWPRRPTGILATIFSSTAGGTAATMSVSI